MSLGYVAARCSLRTLLWPARISLNQRPAALLRRTMSSLPVDSAHIETVLKYARLDNKGYIEVEGPEAVKFLNGLVTSKLQASFVKKNLTTIGNDSGSGGPQRSTEETAVPLADFDVTKTNWGLYHEAGPTGPYISRFGQYTSFLDGKGKLITDSILYPVPVTVPNLMETRYPKYLLEFDKKEMLGRMLQTLWGHKLLSKVKISAVEEDAVRTWEMSIALEGMPDVVESAWITNIWRPMTTLKSPGDASEFTNGLVQSLFHGHEDKIRALYLDWRTDGLVQRAADEPLVFRIVTDNTVDDVSTLFNKDVFDFELNVVPENKASFRKERLRRGLLDGAGDVKPSTVLPLELNFDYFPDVVNSNKGCYIGQELTARTFATGILRKRMISVTVEDPAALAEYLRNCNATGNTSYPEVEIRTVGGTQEEVQSAEPLAASPFGSSSKPVRKRRRPVGSLLASEDDTAVVMMRTEYFDKIYGNSEGEIGNAELYIDTSDESGKESGATEIKLTPQRPLWMDQWLQSNKPNF